MAHTNDPGVSADNMGYDSHAFASIDIIEPEGYGMMGDWTVVRNGLFTIAYSRLASPGKPVYYKEFGIPSWMGPDTNFLKSNAKETDKANYYENVYKMSDMADSDGTCCWWYPGGFRVGENSDFGIISPDGSWRPVTQVINKWSSVLTVDKPVSDKIHWITIDRDIDCRGIFAAYEKCREEMMDAYKNGQTVKLKTAGTGTDSLTVPNVAVGNAKYVVGKTPHKYLNAQFNYVRIKNADGDWQDVEDGSVITVTKNLPVECKVSVVNTGETKWVAPGQAASVKKGSVYVASTAASDRTAAGFKTGIPADVVTHGDCDVPGFVLIAGINKETKVELQMTAFDRAWFGEKSKFILVPK
jgi:hypothetical protein